MKLTLVTTEEEVGNGASNDFFYVRQTRLTAFNAKLVRLRKGMGLLARWLLLVQGLGTHLEPFLAT